MNQVRLGDRIETKERDPGLARPFRAADSLAQRVLNPELLGDALPRYYLQSHPLAVRDESVDQLAEGAPAQLGEFETLFVGKLLNPAHPVFCIVGPMGCGKTTTMEYVALGLVRARHHCGNCPAPLVRLVAHVDFNDHIGLNECAEHELADKLLSIVCDELRARLRVHGVLSLEEELAGYWQYEVERFGDAVEPSKAFRKIISADDRSDSLDFSTTSRQAFVRRQQILSSIENDKGLLLDYLVRLWRYVIHFRYKGSNGCAYIVFDNIDRVAPLIQHRLVDLVLAHARRRGPTFVLIVRPETFKHQGLATNLIDTVPHVGPSPARVVLDRLERFCSDPKGSYDPRDGLAGREFEVLKTHIQRLMRIIRSDHRDPFTVFVNRACGRSIRTGLVLSQGLFMMSIADMKNPEVSLHDAIRRCVTGGEAQFRRTPSGPIENLFSVATYGEESLLVKPRVLRLLGRQPEGERRLNEIVHALSGFGYEADLVLDALTELMRPSCQLVRSNGFDAYHGDAALGKYGGHFVTLTQIGRSYIDHLMYDVDYVQEVMLDTLVNGDRFPERIDYGYLSEKFHLLYLFLNELRRADRAETWRFVEAWGSRIYFDTFGKHMISLDIIHGLYPSTRRILDAVAKKGHEREYSEVRDEFKSLALHAESDNNNLLGIWVQSVTENDDEAR